MKSSQIHVRSQGGRSDVRPRVDPGEIGLLAVQETGVGHAVAIADQEPCPGVAQGGKGLRGAAGMAPVAGHAGAHHHPQPLEGVGEEPGRWIDIVHQSMPCRRSHGAVVRRDGLCHPIEPLLDGPQADGPLEHRGTQALHHAPAIAVGPGPFPHQGPAAGSIATGMLGRDGRLTPATAVRTPALRYPPVRHLHLDWGQLAHLVHIVRARHRKLSVPPPHGASRTSKTLGGATSREH